MGLEGIKSMAWFKDFYDINLLIFKIRKNGSSIINNR